MCAVQESKIESISDNVFSVYINLSLVSAVLGRLTLPRLVDRVLNSIHASSVVLNVCPSCTKPASLMASVFATIAPSFISLLSSKLNSS